MNNRGCRATRLSTSENSSVWYVRGVFEFVIDLRYFIAGSRALSTLVIESANCAKLVVCVISAESEWGEIEIISQVLLVLGNVVRLRFSPVRGELCNRVLRVPLLLFRIARSVRPWDRDTAYRVRHSVRAPLRVYVSRAVPLAHAPLSVTLSCSS